MLRGAAGKLVGIGSGLPSASALARRYISLLVAPWASIAAATTAQLRISVVIFWWMKTDQVLPITASSCVVDNRMQAEPRPIQFFVTASTVRDEMYPWSPFRSTEAATSMAFCSNLVL